MGDYIDRQAAICIIKSMYPGKPRLPLLLKKWAETNKDFIRAENAIMDLPSADVQPVRHGQWIEYDNSHCECPYCHSEWSYFENMVEYFNYCPYCGARMYGE